MKRLSIYMLAAGMATLSTSHSDFLDAVPKDRLTPSTAWQTETDTEGFVVGCCKDLLDGDTLLYLGCDSGIGYNNFPWEGFRPWEDGSLSSSSPGQILCNYRSIRKANTSLENVDEVTFSSGAVEANHVAQAKAVRAYKYFLMNWWYGGVPIISFYSSADGARVERNTEQEARDYITRDLDETLVGVTKAPETRGYIAKDAVLAVKMREALYYGDWQKAEGTAKTIIGLKQYESDPDYANLSKVSRMDSEETVLADQNIETLDGLGTIGQVYNNVDQGWSFIVPAQNLMDAYGMSDGLTKEELKIRDAKHPFANRDPRMTMTILYPGHDWRDDVLNTLDEKLQDGTVNKNFPTYMDNASKSILTWAKRLDPMN